MFNSLEALLRSGREMERQVLEQRWRKEAAMCRFQTEMQIARLEAFNPGALYPAAVASSCAYCGRPSKASARRGDGCDGCGAPLALAARGKK